MAQIMALLVPTQVEALLIILFYGIPAPLPMLYPIW